ncbi:alpha/beta hydrolase [Pedobacter mucosus]|uniref:alpha/beta hydrolase n=1 Tax=Pedobacter mucosus TaxID=2895286 RepID=UPI001EE3BCC8|nr:alpha/beta hydrolase [Pedobacter mucosus]UKT64950.1 alpha/beta hydrolase [Pedobacter mucosus]
MKVRLICFTLSILLGYQISFAKPADSLLNITYGKAKTWKGEQQTLNLDFYFPKKEPGKKYPLALMIHGGGFSTGSKEAMKAHCKILADSGFIAVTINYRKGWDKGVNSFSCEGNVSQLLAAVYRATQDANTALHFLVSKQIEYNIDTAWIFVGGSSAGGVLALNLAYLKQQSAAKIFPDVNNELGLLNLETNTSKQNFSIKGICNMWGAIADSTLITKENAIPTIFYHGTDDIIVPFDTGRFGTYCDKYPLMFGSACVYRRTIAAGKAAILNVAKGANHGPKEFYSKVTMSNTACFFHQIMQGTTLKSNIYYSAKTGCR